MIPYTDRIFDPVKKGSIAHKIGRWLKYSSAYGRLKKQYQEMSYTYAYLKMPSLMPGAGPKGVNDLTCMTVTGFRYTEEKNIRMIAERHAKGDKNCFKSPLTFTIVGSSRDCCQACKSYLVKEMEKLVRWYYGERRPVTTPF